MNDTSPGRSAALFLQLVLGLQQNGMMMLGKLMNPMTRKIETNLEVARDTIDTLAAIPVLKRESHLPVIVDPSHAGGDASLVAPLAFAAIAAGADGLIVEVHPDPERALSDGDQSLAPAAFATMMDQLDAFAAASGRTMGASIHARAVA